jgi:histidinol-phosphate aminotransferase
MILARPNVESLTRYVAPLEGRRGMLRLDFNENTVGPSPAAVEAIRRLPPEAYATYPEYAGLEQAFAEHAGVAPDQCAAFNGVDGAIRAIFDAFGIEGETFLTTSPTFGYYGPCAAMAGMRVNAVTYETDFAFPWERFRLELGSQPRLCFICNPNSPTGTLIEPSKILSLAAEHPDTLFVIDELYQPFTGQSVLPSATSTANVLALRSLSKSMGLAGLRLGFACGCAHVVERVARVTGPYDINTFAVVAGKAALADPEHMQRYVAEVAKAKAFTVAELSRLRVRHHHGGGNYMLVWPGRSVAETEAALRQRGILIRSMAGKPMIDGSFRLSIGTLEQMQRFITTFEAVLKE